MIFLFWLFSGLKAYSLHDLNNNEYTWEVSGCHNQIIRAENSVKYIVSSSFPNVYPQQMDCTWKIQAPLGKMVELTFPTFHVDFCDRAGVKIFDGPKSQAALAEEHCGLDNPGTFRSSGQMVSLQAFQKQTQQGYGTLLQIGYRAVSKELEKPMGYNFNAMPQQNYMGVMPAQNMGLMPYQNGNAALINALSMLTEGNKMHDFKGDGMIGKAPHNRRQPPPKKRRPTAPPKRNSNLAAKKTKVSAKPIVSKTSAKDDQYARMKQKRDQEKAKENELLMRKLIIVIVILILIISGNIWFIWYRRQQRNQEPDLEKPEDINKQSLNERFSYTSRAPVIDNEDSLYCALDDLR